MIRCMERERGGPPGYEGGRAAGLLDKRRRRLPTVAQKPSGGRRAPASPRECKEAGPGGTGGGARGLFVDSSSGGRLSLLGAVHHCFALWFVDPSAFR